MDTGVSNIAHSLAFVYRAHTGVLACRRFYFPSVCRPRFRAPLNQYVRPACAPPADGAFWSCSSCSSRKPFKKPLPCCKKPLPCLAMESKGKGKAAADPPPSQVDYPVWEMTVETSAVDLPIILQAIQRRAQTLLERLRTGGTEDPLRCLCYFMCRIAQLRLGSSVEEPSSSSMEIVDLPELPSKAPSADTRLHVVLIMDGNGRLKSSVKRSMTNLLKSPEDARKPLDPFAEALLRTLRPQTFTWALAMERTSQVHVDWRDSEHSCLRTYLMRRGHSGGALAPAIAAEKLQHGIDLLGPKTKRLAPVQPPMPPLKMLKGPTVQRAESEPQEPSRGPDQNMVRACAKFVAQNGGNVTEEQAEATLKQLLLDLHDTTEELHRAKLELCFYKERDALHAQVRMLSFSHLTRALCQSLTKPVLLPSVWAGEDTSRLDKRYTPSTTPRP